MHAAGVIMSSEPLIDIIPIMRREQDGQIVTQFDYPACEALGLIKMDFLGLRNLTIIDDALDNIEANRGDRLDARRRSRSTTGRRTSCSARGDTLGVFQLDGGPMRVAAAPDEARQLRRHLGRHRAVPPGPDGRRTRTPTTRCARTACSRSRRSIPSSRSRSHEILGTTYGLIIYQEQVMAIAQKVAGFSLGQADILRRAMGKKKKSELDKQFEGFSGGMKANGYSDAAVKTLWDILLPFSDYAFNKAHSAAYGVVSLLDRVPQGALSRPSTWPRCSPASATPRTSSALYLNECRRMGIKVLPPDVNESIGYFAAVGEDIRFGLGAVRNVGMQRRRRRSVRPARRRARFTSFHDFLAQGARCTSRTSAPSSR